MCVLHYVDDLGGIHELDDAESGYHQFAQFCQLLGFRLKPSKAQPPATQQKLLGVVLSIEDEGIRIAPDPGRVLKLRSQIADISSRQALLSQSWHPPSACSCQLHILIFLNSQSGALRALLIILERLTPRFVPFVRHHTPAVIYTDAFFQLGDRCWKPGDPDLPTRMSTQDCVQSAYRAPTAGGLLLGLATSSPTDTDRSPVSCWLSSALAEHTSTS